MKYVSPEAVKNNISEETGMKEMIRCTRCVMDNRSDDTIVFDSEGICDYCRNALSNKERFYFPDETGEKKIQDMVRRLKAENANRKYDCMMGISGGLDSAYLAYLGAMKWGLRIKAVHIDDGFDEPIAKENIENLCKACGIDLVVEKPDAEQFLDLTKAYMKAGVPNIAIPQDNILFEYLYRHAIRNHIRSFISGTNFALECILQRGNSFDPSDAVNIRDIHRKFGTKPINKLPLLSAQRKILYKYFYRIETLRPLNYIDYNKDQAIKELEENCGFRYYGGKHLENTLTKFIQLYWLYNKFGVDKRTSHFSSMIISGQMTREEALIEMEKPLYDEARMNIDIDMILKKLGMSRSELEQIMKDPTRQHTEFKTSDFTRFCNFINARIKKMK